MPSHFDYVAQLKIENAFVAGALWQPGVATFLSLVSWRTLLSLSSSTGNWCQLADNLMHIAPRPFVTVHNRTHDWVLGFMKVLCRVLPGRRIATAHVGTCHALSQSDPLSPFLQTFLACSGRMRRREISFRQMLQVFA